jgi:SAM-dependent methyltransferase
MPITSEEIAWSYRLLLGREAAEAELHAWRNVESLQEMRRLCLLSDEFRSGLERSLAASVASAASKQHAPRLNLNLPPQEVEWRTDAATQARLIDHVMKTWTKLGQEKPHWSVLSAEQFLPDRIEETKANFYASGANDVSRITTALKRHGKAPEQMRRVVEYGCGVGRVTPHLAKTFAEVVGIDISSSHLDMARDAARSAGTANARFVLARAPDFGMYGPFDLWFSYIVLQHNPPPVIALVLRRALGLLAPGGFAMFQVPTFATGYRHVVADYLGKPTETGTIEMHCLPQNVIFAIAAEAGCRLLEVREDTSAGPPQYWLSNTFIFTK